MQKTLLQDFQEGGFSATTSTATTSTLAHHHNSPSTTTTTTTRSGSMKRSLSPSSATPSPVPEKTRKISPTIQGGYAKLPLPFTFPSTTTTNLHRTMSEPIPTFKTINPRNAPFSPFTATSCNPSSSSIFLKPQFQETNNKNFPASSNALQGLLRSFSDPSSLSFGIKTSDSPSSQRMEKMRGFIKGISQLCDEVICEEEKGNQDYSKHEKNEDEIKDNQDFDNNVNEEDKEAVRVEKRGDCFGVQFNCACGIGYEILLSGNNCYYKLT